jgi:hypothetical protein
MARLFSWTRNNPPILYQIPHNFHNLHNIEEVKKMSVCYEFTLAHGDDDASDTSSLSAPTFDSGLSSSESTNTPSSSGTSNPTKKRRVVMKLTADQIRFLLESFVEAMQAPPKSRLTMNKFADLHEVKRSTFKGYLKVSGLSEMNQKGELQSVSRFVIQTRINAYLAQRARNEGKRHSSESMSFLTEEEQELLIQYASMLAIIGHGISKRVLLDLINAIINKDVEKRDQTLATMAVVQKMMKKHPGLMRLVKANSLDPQRAKKATQAVCDHYFAKLENFIKLTNSLGIHVWKSAADVPGRNWYNMDEKSVNPNKAMDKVSHNPYIFVFVKICKYTNTRQLTNIIIHVFVFLFLSGILSH